MRLTIDTDNRKIIIEENVNLGKLFRVLEDLLPDDLWKEFTLERITTPIRMRDIQPTLIQDHNRIPIDYVPNNPNPYQQPWFQVNVDGTNTGGYSTNNVTLSNSNNVFATGSYTLNVDM